MSTHAVTRDASAASDREPNSRFLPTDKNYRLTGALPDELEVAGTQRIDDGEYIPEGVREEREQERQHEKKDKADTGDASAASESETAAASEAAEPQRKEAQAKTERTSESRWAKVTRENRELREKLARAEGAQSASQTATQRDTSQASQPAAEAKTATNPEPQIDDVDAKTGKALYATLSEFLNAHSKWNRTEALREFDERSSKTAKERELSENEKIINRTIDDRVAEIRKTHSDYDTTIKTALAEKDEHGQDAFFYTKGSPIDGFFLDSDRSHDVMYEIGKNFDLHRHIFARDAQGKYLLNPVRQLRELSKIENALPEKSSTAGGEPTTGRGAAASASSSAKPVTQAPRPAHQVSGTGAVRKDAIEDAIETGDSESYIREANARALAKLKRK